MEGEIIDQLAAIVGRDNLLTAPEELCCYSYDGTGCIFLPEAVALPGSAGEIAAILQLANRKNFPVVPRGAGTGMTGGSLPTAGGLVLVTTRMNRILDIDPDNMVAVVEPGVVTGDLQKILKKHRLLYPPDPASLKFCTIGGNAAECAGGPSAVKYGVTKDYVIGLEIVLPTGEIMHTGVRTEKGVAGYDLIRLFVGSEGTLGIFTRLILRLLPLPDRKETYLLYFTSLARATALVSGILAVGIRPCTLEYMDRTAIRVIGDHLPPAVPPDTAALLLVEIDGSDEEVRGQQVRLVRYLERENISWLHAGDEKEREAIWRARRSISPAVFSLRPHKISEDVVVPRSRIPELVSFAEDLGRELGITILTFGHAGDGNIHVNIMLDRENVSEAARGEAARKKLFDYVMRLCGTLSGEHGIGITKAEFMPLEIDATALAVMRKIKRLLDPNNILNPGKIFPGLG